MVEPFELAIFKYCLLSHGRFYVTEAKRGCNRIKKSGTAEEAPFVSLNRDEGFFVFIMIKGVYSHEPKNNGRKMAKALG